MKLLYLENTTGSHYKFYKMEENPGGTTWTATWGKIGTKGQTKTYPISDWNTKFTEKLKKGYVDNTPTPDPKLKTNEKHLEKVAKVYILLNQHQDLIDRSAEHIRDVGAIRETLKNPEPPLNGSLSKQDMEYLNTLWKQIHVALKNERELV
jgi:poly [ADP-ribose] polymerase